MYKSIKSYSINVYPQKVPDFIFHVIVKSISDKIQATQPTIWPNSNENTRYIFQT